MFNLHISIFRRQSKAAPMCLKHLNRAPYSTESNIINWNAVFILSKWEDIDFNTSTIGIVTGCMTCISKNDLKGSSFLFSKMRVRK